MLTLFSHINHKLHHQPQYGQQTRSLKLNRKFSNVDTISPTSITAVKFFLKFPAYPSGPNIKRLERQKASNHSNMSSNQSQSYSYSSTSYSSSSVTGDGQNYTKSSTVRSHTNDRDGTTTERVTNETGKPTLVESTQTPAGGRAVEGSGGISQDRRIEDVTDDDDADKRYLDAMEDEYAKREGGA